MSTFDKPVREIDLVAKNNNILFPMQYVVDILYDLKREKKECVKCAKALNEHNLIFGFEIPFDTSKPDFRFIQYHCCKSCVAEGYVFKHPSQ